MPNFYIYSAADIGLSDTFANWFASPSSTVSGTASPDILEMSDDDLLLENEGGGSDQFLSQDMYIDGVLVGSAGDTVINLGRSSLTNDTTGEIGDLIVIQINGVAVGYATTVELNAGDTISMTAWAGTLDEVAYEELAPYCFTRGTLILTRHGEVAIENLKQGDIVWTHTGMFQPIRWIATQKCAGTGRLAPIRFATGSLGNARDLTVSPMHRMLVSGWQVDVLFGQREMLVHARDLVNGSTIRAVEMPLVDYYHILFDTHQIILSNGIKSESFHPFSDDLANFDTETQQELFEIFPALQNKSGCFSDAFQTLTTAETTLLQNL